MDLSAYRAVLRVPEVPRLLASSLVGRMPGGMSALSIVLLLQHTTSSYAQGGAVAGAYMVAIGVGAPLQGRLIDRVGQPRVLLPALAVFAVGFVTLALAATAGAPLGFLLVLAVLTGLTVPSLSSCMRTLWSAKLGRDPAPGTPARTDTLHTADTDPAVATPPAPAVATPSLQTAFALDSTVQELIFITGPMLAAALATAISPVAGVVTAVLLAVVGTLSFTTTAASRSWRAQPGRVKDWAGPLRVAGIRTLLTATFLFGGTIGMIEVSVTAFAQRSGAAGMAGVLLGIWSAGSMVGGLLYGTRAWPGTVGQRLLTLGWLIPLAVLPTALAGALWQLGLVLPLAGLLIAPLLTCLYVVVEDLAPPGTLTESFTWVLTGFLSGIAGGTAVGGTLIEVAGTRVSMGTAALSAAVGGLVLLTCRRTYAPAAE